MVIDYLFVTLIACMMQCELILAEDGSGRGAAFVAAVATRLAGASSTVPSSPLNN